MKKAFLFTITIFFITTVLLIQAYIILSEKQSIVQGIQSTLNSELDKTPRPHLGNHPIFAAQAQLDDAMFYIDQAALQVTWETVFDLAKAGGTTRCGRIQGVALLNTQENDILTCVVPVHEQYSQLIRTKLNKILNNYPTPLPTIDHISVVSSDKLHVYGSSGTQLTMRFDSNKHRISDKPRFHISIPYNLDDYKSIYQGLNTLITDCKQTDLESCITTKIKIFSTPDLLWSIGPCNTSPLKQERTVAFCAKTTKKYTHYTNGKLSYDPITYSFAVYIPSSTPLRIKSFSVNYLPISNKPTDNAVLAIKEGDKLDYTAHITSPTTQDLNIAFCAGEICEVADNIKKENEQDEYLITGTMNSPQPPYEIKLRATLQDKSVQNTGSIKSIKITSYPIP